MSLDRLERAPDSERSALQVITEKYGFPAVSIVTMNDVMTALYTEGDKTVITDDIKKELDVYYSQWGAK